MATRALAPTSNWTRSGPKDKVRAQGEARGPVLELAGAGAGGGMDGCFRWYGTLHVGRWIMLCRVRSQVNVHL